MGEAGKKELDELRERVQQLESELSVARTTAQRFRLLFQASNDAMLVMDPVADRVLDANARAARMLGYAPNELIGGQVSRIFLNEMEKLLRFAQGVFRRGDGFTSQLSCTTKYGRSLPADISAGAIEIDSRKCLLVSARVNFDAIATAEAPPELGVEGDEAIIGASGRWSDMLTVVQDLSSGDEDVLIAGESGCGKNVVARVLHRLSLRADVPMITVRCAAVGDASLAAVLGRGGATLGAQLVAEGDTVFLDELGDLAPRNQSELAAILRATERSVDVRVIASATFDSTGRLPIDPSLVDAFGARRVEVPPLRERASDIPLLAEHFLDRCSAKLGVARPSITRAGLRRLEGYPWPGNVRELFNTVERGVILAQEGRLHIELDDSVVVHADSGRVDVGGSESPVDFASMADALSLEDLKRLEIAIIERALEQCRGKVYGEDGAAARLRLPPSTLVSRMKKLGLGRDGRS